jgi:hypothetical protein
MTALELRIKLSRYRFNFVHEDQLQNGIAQALVTEGIEFEAEVKLSVRDRIDFMVGKLGIEVKVASPPALVMKQIHRYAQLPQIDEILLITNRCRHLMVPEIVNGKPVEVLFIAWGML